MLFIPRQFESVAAIKIAFQHADAGSDTTIDGKDVFGYVDDVAYEAVEIFDEYSQDWFWIAGNPI